ncbi:MAG: dihydroorotate dehydrogenase [Planctomycetes bacterium]|nr:dihydroorotate dehydrogenase [Planctomycetota bacterium]
MVDLGVDIAGVRLANPLMTASGTCGYAREYEDFFDLRQLGAFVTKSITAKPRTGNQPQRVVETPAGLLNAIGLENVGLARFLDEKVPELETLGVPVFVNVAGAELSEYLTVVEALSDVPVVRGVELNISCPNVKAGGMSFGVEPNQAAAVTSAVKVKCGKNILIVKLTPNVTDIAEIARAVVDAGADALSMVNTLTAMVVDVATRRPILANDTGGLSGPAIHPVAVYMVHRVYTRVARAAGVPIIGMGGIQDWRGAVEFLLAGATGLAVGTAMFADPTCLSSIREGIADYLQKYGHDRVGEIVGALQLNRSE